MNTITRTVEELLEGGCDNMSQKELDDELKLFNKIAKELGVEKSEIKNMTAIIDEDYEMELDKMESPYVLDERNGISFIFVKDEDTAEQEINAQEERYAEYEREE